MHCPYHGDANRSAGINVEEGVFRCHGCGEFKTVDQLLKDEKEWDVPSTSSNFRSSSRKPKEEINESVVEGWHSALLSNSKRLNALMRQRGLSIETIENYELGWDQGAEAYTIPIRDSAGNISNVRRYQLDVPEGRRKIWSVDGMGTPTLYPVDQLDHPSIMICEGEMDALLSIQKGIPAITRTGAADVWQPSWSHAFSGKNVYVCHDMDTKGQRANTRIASAVRQYAKKIVVLKLPYPVTEDHGKDLTDYWMAGASRADFIELIRETVLPEEQQDSHDDSQVDPEPETVTVNVMNSFDAGLVERPVRMSVTVVGKKTPSYLVPKVVAYSCDDVASMPKCKRCVFERLGQSVIEYEIPADSPLILKLVGVTEEKKLEIIQREAGILKCPVPRHEVGELRTVEEIYVRPSIEEFQGGKQDFTHRQAISSATHDLAANESVILTGTIRPNPKTQTNEFQAWKVDRPETGLDHFHVDDDVLEEMREFTTSDPMKMLHAIADDLARNHTKIYGRDNFHIFADLVFHSVLELPFPGFKDEKGWLDAIAIGDTRTGKSAASEAMLNLYGCGELVSCEAASFAGVVGGLDKVGDAHWVVKWGAIPINDRRAVVLDEVSGLTVEQISQMSSMRSSGRAELTKIKSETALARTRLLWLGNPRGESMDSVAYGTDALRKLIGNPEDIARFDMAMGVFSKDVPSGEINRHRPGSTGQLFSREAYRGVIKWAWTRKPENIKWGKGVDELVLAKAGYLGQRYIEVPPLVQVANVRMKIARIAAAIAARTYSTRNGEDLLLRDFHVEAAVQFLEELYSHVRFGYRVVSQQHILDREATERALPEIRKYLAQRPHLTRFMLNSPTFNKFQMQSLLNVSDEEASVVIGGLWERKAVEMHGNQIRVVPVVLDSLRGTMIGDE